MKSSLPWDSKALFLGIDQTGAIDRSGHPKPLASCLISNNKAFPFYLKSFSKSEIFETLQIKPGQKLVVCADCVLGLPNELAKPWRQVLGTLKDSRGYGRTAAQKFFSDLGQGKIFSRSVELKAKANSVFREKPFQKNIQTGTYRLWKEISEDPAAFAVPYLNEKPKPGQIPIYEGYPSLSWKLLFAVKTRAPKALPGLIRTHFPEIVIQKADLKRFVADPNLADALVLALTLKKLGVKTAAKNLVGNEGWILGFES